jgi:site-specific DNA-methyltransferase (adenine-specific)
MIIQYDAVAWANEYDGPLFHALLCDPPYHLTSIVKRFGKDGSAPAQFGTDGVYSRASKGFMGKTWDGGDVAFRPETWAAFMKVLYPGAFGMAYASSRGWHRLAVAIEDAGFIIHPTIFSWLYASGFPKAHKINTENAKVWEGHRYGLQALKPALEPIIVFQKPYEGRPVDNMVETGAGALNIDGARIRVDPNVDDMLRTVDRGQRESPTWEEGSGFKNETNHLTGVRPEGRWPANFILGDDGAAEALDAQSGLQKGGFVRNRTAGARVFENNGKPTDYEMTAEIDEPDGGASRFFFRVQEELDEADPVYYCSKVSKAERNAGLEQNNLHPTLKPIALSKYLATLLLPPGMYAPRRLFVPFAGAASECIGGHQAGWEEITGIEMEYDYVQLGIARSEYWISKPAQPELFST